VFLYEYKSEFLKKIKRKYAKKKDFQVWNSLDRKCFLGVKFFNKKLIINYLFEFNLNYFTQKKALKIIQKNAPIIKYVFEF